MPEHHFDEELLQEIRKTMARERPSGLGVTPYELADKVEYSVRNCRKTLDKKVKSGDMQKERMIDFDGMKRTVYYSVDTPE